MRTPVIQFGTSRFLQAHALSFLQSGTPAGEAPHVTVVQTTDDPARRPRLDALAAPEGYRVEIRGLEDGAPVERAQQVRVVKRSLAFSADYAKLAQIVATEARWIISNTADRGFDPQPADSLPRPDPAQSYPAKLYHLLAARHLAGGGALTILPTELVAGNGDVLRARVMEIAREQGADAALMEALDQHLWVNSLVDRIVSQELFPAGAVAEPYALWAIEDQPGLALPVTHPAIRIIPDLEPIQRLKLHVLNLGHTALVDLWQQAGKRETHVREAMSGPLAEALSSLYRDEVLAGFEARGMGDQARDYLAETLDRFANPFLDHRLSDIEGNHASKISHRVTDFLDWSGLTPARAPRLHALSAKGA